MSTNPTTHPDLIAAIKKLDKHVPWYKEIDLEYGLVIGDDGKGTCYSRIACEAAVVMYAEDLKAWGRQQRSIVCDISTAEGGRLWKWFVSGLGHFSSEFEKTRTEAAIALIIALIIAIAASLEE